MNHCKDIVNRYYQGWLKNNREVVESLLDSSLVFKSANDHFTSKQDFLDACWQYSSHFNKMDVLHEIYTDNQAYIIYNGDDFCCGELVKLKNNKIIAIYVTSDPIH